MIYYYSGGNDSNFWRWGRWVLLGILVCAFIFAMITFFLVRKKNRRFRTHQNASYPANPQQNYVPGSYNAAEAGMNGQYYAQNYGQGSYGEGNYGQPPNSQFATAAGYNYSVAEEPAPAYEAKANTGYTRPSGPPPGHGPSSN